MKPSRKFLSLPIISLREGQHIGYVKSLILDPEAKALAAIVIDPKGFFKDQRIIPYNKVVSVGEDAITIDTGNHVEKSATIPEILTLIKEKLNIIGTKVVTEAGKTLGIAEEYYIDPENGNVTDIEISGGKIEGLLNGKALLTSNQVITIGHDVIVAQKGSESYLTVSDKGISDAFKSILHSTTHVASETTNSLTKYFKKDNKNTVNSEADIPFVSEEDPIEAAQVASNSPESQDEAEKPSDNGEKPVV